MSAYVYILASRRNGTIYIGSTTDLPKRIYEHREGLVAGFTKEYGVKRLVYVEIYDDISDAIVRERRMKEWRRDWKVRLIEKDNPYWEDLAVTLLGFEPLPSVILTDVRMWIHIRSATGDLRLPRLGYGSRGIFGGYGCMRERLR
jgi:putative endonuclease